MENTIYSLFRRQVETQPEALAVLDEQRRLSFRELDELIETILRKFPKSTPVHVGIVMDHSVEMIASILAVLKSGAAYIPVEPSFPIERIRFIMRETRVDFILTNSRYDELLAEFQVLNIEPGLEIEASGASTEPGATPDSLAYILYTSGTMGTPKGVMVDNRNVCHYVRAFEHEFHVKPGDVMLQYSVCSFDIFVEELFTTLLNGATLAIPSDKTKKDIQQLMRFAEENRVTEISGFPYLLLEMNKLESIPSSLRLLISGGDVLRGSYITNLKDKVMIYNTYGPSETTVCASYYRCDNAEPLADGTFPIGKPVLGSGIEILDENLNRVKDGVTGEIGIFGDGISRGYLGQKPENENFTSTPDGRYVYLSGDLGYVLPDGNIAFLRRKDTQVMILGKRVECEEVENVLNNCEEVEQGVVIAHLDTQGLAYLTAYIVPTLCDFSLRELKRHLALYLTPFMIPEFFVEMASMPMTPNGKVDRRALPIVLKEGTL